MKTIIRKCSFCDGSGMTGNIDERVECLKCGGIGREFMGEVDFPEFDDILDKIKEVKTKVNQMQADINYIKAKVG